MSNMQHNHGVVGNIEQRPWGFSVAFLTLFALTVVFLAWVDLLPEPAVRVVQAPVATSTPQTPPVTTALQEPVRITAAGADTDAAVVNPTSTSIPTLDAALERGAVRYPTSARLGENGTVLLFGHSTSIALARSHFKTFNNIQNLKTGEIVSVYSSTHEYRYAVTGVRRADAEEDVIELRSDGRYLVLVTCNTFAEKTARFIVEAEFVSSRSL